MISPPASKSGPARHQTKILKGSPRHGGYEGGRSLGGEAFGGERLGRRRFFDVGRRRGSSFLDLIEQPCLDRGCRAVSFRIVMGKAARFEDDGTQFRGAAAARVVEVD